MHGSATLRAMLVSKKHAVALVALFWTVSADACLHAGGGGSTAPVTQGGQQAIILRHDGVQDLILRVQYKVPDPAAMKHLGWVVPLPAVPSRYATASPDLFSEMDAAVKLVRRYLPRSVRKGTKSAGGTRSAVRLLPPAKAGPYRIQPIRATGAQAATALNVWMKKNGFKEIPTASLKYYTDRSWTFLAIRIDPAEGQKNLDAHGGLPPLHMTFKSERVVYAGRMPRGDCIDFSELCADRTPRGAITGVPGATATPRFTRGEGQARAENMNCVLVGGYAAPAMLVWVGQTLEREHGCRLAQPTAAAWPTVCHAERQDWPPRLLFERRDELHPGHRVDAQRAERGAPGALVAAHPLDQGVPSGPQLGREPLEHPVLEPARLVGARGCFPRGRPRARRVTWRGR